MPFSGSQYLCPSSGPARGTPLTELLGAALSSDWPVVSSGCVGAVTDAVTDAFQNRVLGPGEVTPTGPSSKGPDSPRLESSNIQG